MWYCYATWIRVLKCRLKCLMETAPIVQYFNNRILKKLWMFPGWEFLFAWHNTKISWCISHLSSYNPVECCSVPTFSSLLCFECFTTPLTMHSVQGIFSSSAALQLGCQRSRFGIASSIMSSKLNFCPQA